MQQTAVIPTGGNIIRGLLSESAVGRALEILEASYVQHRLPKIIRVTPVVKDVTPGGKHADFIVDMEDSAGIVSVPIEVKSSDRCANHFKSNCRRKGWGEIPVVVAYKSERVLDFSPGLIERCVKALLSGFNHFRRKLCSSIARQRNHALKKRRYRRDDSDTFIRIPSRRLRYA